VPAAAAEIAFQNKETVYAILFRAAAEALRTIAADPKYLGAEIGLVAVLHSWGQTLQHHPISTASCRAAAHRADRCSPIESGIADSQSGVSDKPSATQSP
jgi:hypothetical protein